MSKSLTFYPVRNGQSILLTLEEDTTHILFDLLQIPEEPEEGDKRTNVRAELLKALPKTSKGVFHIAVACFSHDDQDHCQGFERVFRTGAPSTDEGDGIQIDELWVPVRVITEDDNDCSESAKALRKEANRRLDLAIDPDRAKEADKDGNRIVVFGNTIDKRIGKLPDDKRYSAGQVVKTIGGKDRDDFEMFVHCPFRKDSDDDGVDANDACLIGQVVITDGDSSMRVLLGGDSACRIWKQVWNQTKSHRRLERLDSNVYVCTHHGSYRFFTEMDGQEGREEAKKDPAAESMKILDRIQKGGILVCSSRPVSDANYKDDLPPHTEATNHYKNRAKDVSGDFKCTMEEPSKKEPKPLVIELTPGGPRANDASTGAVLTATAAAGTSRWGHPRG